MCFLRVLCDVQQCKYALVGELPEDYCLGHPTPLVYS